MLYRLNRALAATGLCSRRKADEFISNGRVRVNGQTVTDFNHQVDPTIDQLELDYQKISIKNFDYILLYKPEGVVTTCNDERQRESVLDLLPSHLQHVRPVGRLDRDSAGLLLLTNDGELAQQLTHPSHKVFKRYEVTVTGCLDERAVNNLQKGVRLEEGVTLPAEVHVLERNKESSKFQIAIREGRNRQIRRMCAQLGYPVFRLLRVAIGELQLRQMRPGEWRRLTAQEIATLRSNR